MAFLCGEDSFTGKNFDHRRGWIETRIRELATIFAIDLAAYSVMNNHYHMVIRIDQERTLLWTDEEVLRRWTIPPSNNESMIYQASLKIK